MLLIDTHCHLNYDYAPKTADDLVREAREAGVEKLITIGTDIDSIDAIQKISEQYENVYHTLGVHPHDVEKISDQDLGILEKRAQHPKCKAIGEIGLDYYYEHSQRQVQIQRLEQQLELALKLQLPVVIHSRDGEDDLLVALRHYCGKLKNGKIPGVIHCFTGTIPFGQQCIDLGFYISFSGILTFKNAEDVRAAARLFPMERLLVETDSPYLAPVPFRGKKCEPAMVKFTAQKLAEVKGMGVDEVAAKTTENAQRVFGI